MDNQQLFFAIFSLHNQYPAITPFMVALTNYSPYLSFTLAILFALTTGSKAKRALIILSLGLLIGFLLISFIHLFIQVPRPFVTYHLQPLITPPASFSFPSGHSLTMAVICAAFFFTRSFWAWFFLPITLLVAFSRVYVGVHYPADVIGGFTLGFIVSYLIGFILNLRFPQTSRVV